MKLARHRVGVPGGLVLLMLALSPVAAEGPAPRAVGVKPAASSLGTAENNWLVAVGVNTYSDTSVTPLKYCAADAEAIHAFFTETGLVKPSQAYLLETGASDPKFRPTRNNILRTVQYVSDHAGPASTILLSVSGHGFVDDKQASYLLPEDGESGLLRDTAVPMARVNEMLRESKSKRKVVFVDACRNAPKADGKGAMDASQSAAFLEALKAGEGQVTMAACAAGQKSYEMDEGKHGVFTHYLLEGLKGGAQADANGMITLSSLQTYVASAVPDWCKKKQMQPQQPWMWGEMSVPIPLAMKSGQGTLSPVDTPRLDEMKRKADELARVKKQAEEAYAKAEGIDASGLPAADKREAWEVAMAACSPAAYRLPEIRARINHWKQEGENANYTETAAGLNLEMIWVPGGSFSMGAETGNDEEKPVHSVRVDGFWMGKCEVTVGQFRKFVDATTYKTDAEKAKKTWTLDANGKFVYQAGFSWHRAEFPQTNSHPVVNVSWDDAMAFCRWLSVKTDRRYALPSEAQWEYGCRGGTQTVWAWGDRADDGAGWLNAADQDAKHKYPNWDTFNFKDGYVYTAPVGSFRPNAFGFCDMHGNVWEWCADWYGEKYYSESGRENPSGPSTGTYRVARGGSWFHGPIASGSAKRGWGADPSSTFGFRIVCAVGSH